MAYNNSFVESVFPFNHLDDISFSAALYEMSHGPIIFDFDRLDTLVFNPVEHLSSAHSLSTNLDPDLNFYATSSYTCNYMVENEINKLATVKRGNSDFSLLHLNCRSLLGHFDDFKALIANLHESFCSIGISETWLNDQTFDLVNLPGYAGICGFLVFSHVYSSYYTTDAHNFTYCYFN